jgi:hypothetical protein
MARAYLIFGDIEGKLDVLRVECTKCDRKGCYHVHKLIEKYGRMGNISAWVSNLKSDCPNRFNVLLRCDPTCPDLPKVL